jgi:hypothetical protein
VKTHEETLPAYEDVAHLVPQIVREELQPVVEELRALRDGPGSVAQGPSGSEDSRGVGRGPMRCYDCSIAGRFAEAVGVCSDSGSGVCLEHAVVAARHLTRVGLINRVERVEPAARVLRCQTCALARQALSSPPPGTRAARGRHLLGVTG